MARPMGEQVMIKAIALINWILCMVFALAMLITNLGIPYTTEQQVMSGAVIIIWLASLWTLIDG